MSEIKTGGEVEAIEASGNETQPTVEAVKEEPATAETEPVAESEPVVAGDATGTTDTPDAPDASPASVASTEESAQTESAEAKTAEPEKKAEPTAEQQAEKEAKAAAAKAKQAKLAPLYRAYRSSRAIDGRVEQVIKGGYEVRINSVRAFCPHSQMDLQPVAEPETMIGRNLGFKVMQVRRGGDDVVVSRRGLLEEQRREEGAAVRATLIEGAVMQGHVTSVAAFGAFVDLGAGVTGLVHVSELSHNRVERPDQAVKVSDAVQVKLLKIDAERDRISLSIRQATPDPWADVAERFQPGSVYPGTVRRLADFGAFVELAPGVDALAPASELPPVRGDWKESLPTGHASDWLVLSLDPAQRRISVTAPGEGYDPANPPTVEAGKTLTGRVQRIEKFGVFVWLAPGRVGLVPNALTGTPPGTDLSSRFPIGEEFEVDVLEIAEDGRRIRLKRKGVEATAPPSRPQRDAGGPSHRRDRPRSKDRRSDRADRKPRPDLVVTASASDPGNEFGSLLADKLKAALGPEQEG